MTAITVIRVRVEHMGVRGGKFKCRTIQRRPPHGRLELMHEFEAKVQLFIHNAEVAHGIGALLPGLKRFVPG
jgi:hypothetical protein